MVPDGHRSWNQTGRSFFLPRGAACFYPLRGNFACQRKPRPVSRLDGITLLWIWGMGWFFQWDPPFSDLAERDNPTTCTWLFMMKDIYIYECTHYCIVLVYISIIFSIIFSNLVFIFASFCISIVTSCDEDVAVLPDELRPSSELRASLLRAARHQIPGNLSNADLDLLLISYRFTMDSILIYCEFTMDSPKRWCILWWPQKDRVDPLGMAIVPGFFGQEGPRADFQPMARLFTRTFGFMAVPGRFVPICSKSDL